MSRRSRERDTRRQLIVDAARSLFERKGIEATRMEDIAKAAEYTRRTLYTYFKSRDDICLRVHVEDVARRWGVQKRALARLGEADAPTRLRVWADALHAFWKDNPHSMRVEQYWDYHGIDPSRLSGAVFEEFEALNDELAEGLREIFRCGIEEGTLRDDLPVDVCISQFLYSLRAILGRALSSSYSFAEADPDEYVHRFLEQYARSIRA